VSSEANHRFAKKMLDIASIILELIKDALNIAEDRFLTSFSFQ
jgi:hypothetical protein